MKKIIRWDSLPTWLIYLPVYPYYLYLSIKSQSFTFFSTLNPLMKYGGMIEYSKFESLKYVDKKFLPKTLLVSKNLTIENVLISLDFDCINFPVVAKPNEGERGRKVNILYNKNELQQYHGNNHFDYVVQEYIELPVELSVLYFRYPGIKKGAISSIVLKRYPTVIGNGIFNIGELINNSGYKRKLKKLFSKINGSTLEKVPLVGEEIILCKVGNISHGTLCQDYSMILCDKLVDMFDSITMNMIGFYFGRFDLKINSMAEFLQGEHIKILEVNGANSIPLHIFDKNTTLKQVYRTLYKHWSVIYKISSINHRNGIAFSFLFNFLKDLFMHMKKVKS